ncbi:MAG TPA: TIGR04076 family protein [Armatimonadetes bacterium]|nr:TIGR04076 family protein [Armatimonadota bacterium]
MAVTITVKGGVCQGGIHQVGQVITVERTTPSGMCLGAWNAVAPYVTALLFGADFPWEREKGLATIHCPDPQGITLELRRREGRR